MNLSDAITDAGIAIRCMSKEDAEALLNAYEGIGLDVPSIGTWDDSQSRTCYRRCATQVHFCHLDFYMERGYKIVDFDSLIKNLEPVSLSDYLY